MMSSGHAAVRFREADAERHAADIYGLRVTARALPSEFDDNFHLVAEDGAGTVLKVMHPDRDAAFVAMQCAALAHLASRAPDLLLPRVVRTQGGEPFTTVAAPGADRRLVWMVTYAPGTPLVHARPRTAALLRGLGRFLGRMDVALADFSHAATERTLLWDFARSGWIREHLGLLADPPRRALVEGILARYDTDVAPALPGLRHSVVHHDANDHNVLVAGGRGGAREVVSLIDFGDMLRTATVAEVAVAAAYALLGESDLLAAAAAVVAGYHESHPLR